MADERLKELRARLGISRSQLAAELGRSEPTFEKYEAVIPTDLAEALADYAERKGLPDLARRFRAKLGEEDVAPQYDDPDHKMLEIIKRSGIRTAIEAIQSNLRWFSLTAQALEGNTDIWNDVKTDEEATFVATVLRVLRGGKTTATQRMILKSLITGDLDKKEPPKRPNIGKAR